MQLDLDIAHIRVYLLATMDDEYGINTCFCQVGSAQDALHHYILVFRWCDELCAIYLQQSSINMDITINLSIERNVKTGYSFVF